MRLARLNDSGHFKEIEVSALKRYGQAVADHCWLGSKSMVFIDGQHAFRLVEDSALKQTIQASHMQPTTLEPLRNGFIAGCTDGQVVVYARKEQGADFSLACRVRGPSGQGPVRSLQVGEQERHVLVMCEEVCLLPLRDALARARLTQSEGISDEDPADGERPGSPKMLDGKSFEASKHSVDGVDLSSGRGGYEVLLRSAHSARIVSLSVAVSKPLLASCADDQTIRVWDLRSNTCQFVAPLAEQPHAIALHPDGMQLAVVLDSKLSLFHLALDSLLAWRDVPNHAGRCISYSHGGHLLAASSGRAVAVYEAFSLTRVANLAAHLAPVTALAWAADDSAFTTGGADGMLYTWSCEGPLRRVHEGRLYKNAGVGAIAVLSVPRYELGANEDEDVYGSRAATPGGGGSEASFVSKLTREHSVLVVGGEPHGHHDHSGEHGRGKPMPGGGGGGEPNEVVATSLKKAGDHPTAVLRLVERSDEQNELPLPCGDGGLSMVATLPAARLALVGGSDGSLFTLTLGREGAAIADKMRPKGLAVRPHSGAVTALTATADEQLLFSGGADGSLFVFQRADLLQQQQEAAMRAAALAPAGAPEAAAAGSNSDAPSHLSDLLRCMRRLARTSRCRPPRLPCPAPTECSAPLSAQVHRRAVRVARAARALRGRAVRSALRVHLPRVQCEDGDDAHGGHDAGAPPPPAKSPSSRPPPPLPTPREPSLCLAPTPPLASQASLSEKLREHSGALADADRRARSLAAEHNTAIASMQSKFAEFAARAEEKRRSQQLHLETVLRREISKHDEVQGQFGHAREEADATRLRLQTELNQSLSAHEADEARHVDDLEAIKAEHEQVTLTAERRGASLCSRRTAPARAPHRPASAQARALRPHAPPL